MLPLNHFEISHLFIKFTSFLDNVVEKGSGATYRQVFPSVTQGTEGYKILAIIIAVICVIAFVMFVILIVKAYKDSRAESKNFGARVKGDLQYPGYNRGHPKPTIDPNDKGKDVWGKIDDE